MRALYGVPLIAQDSLLGVLTMGSVSVYEFSAGDKARVAALADRAAAAILQHQLRAAAERWAQRLAAIQELTAALNAQSEQVAVVETILAKGLPLLGATAGMVLVPDGPALSLRRSRGYEPDDLGAWRRGPLDADSPLLRSPQLGAAQAKAVVIDEARAGQPDRELRLDGAGESRGEWDPDRLAQLLANLVRSALSYSAPGTPVRVGWRGAADTVVLEVENRGPPIPPALLPRLYEPFRRGAAAGARAPRGLGLGLFISREIVRAHGGTIGARSTADATVFTVTLPRRVPIAAPAGAGR